MVSEETSMICNRIQSDSATKCDKNWLSKINYDKIETIRDKNSNVSKNRGDVEFVEGVVREICDKAINIVMTRERKILVDERSLKKLNHRRTSIVENELFGEDLEFLKPPLSLVDENDNKYVCEAINPTFERKNSKKKKKLSFSFLTRKHKSKDSEPADQHPENYDTFDPNAKVSIARANTLGWSRKFSSAMELNQKPSTLHRTSSFLKKIVHIGEESKNLLKRSMSVRDLSKKKHRSREKLSEEKQLEWKQSLQSLVENDVSVSYHDLSFVDYDVMNDINYDDNFLRPDNGGHIGRTQSMFERVSKR